MPLFAMKLFTDTCRRFLQGLKVSKLDSEETGMRLEVPILFVYKTKYVLGSDGYA
jgi:hypothetical protein